MNEGNLEMCEKYGLIFQSQGNGDWVYIDYESKVTTKEMELIGKALKQAEEKGFKKAIYCFSANIENDRKNNDMLCSVITHLGALKYDFTVAYNKQFLE